MLTASIFACETISARCCRLTTVYGLDGCPTPESSTGNPEHAGARAPVEGSWPHCVLKGQQCTPLLTPSTGLSFDRIQRLGALEQQDASYTSGGDRGRQGSNLRHIQQVAIAQGESGDKQRHGKANARALRPCGCSPVAECIDDLSLTVDRCLVYGGFRSESCSAAGVA